MSDSMFTPGKGEGSIGHGCMAWLIYIPHESGPPTTLYACLDAPDDLLQFSNDLRAKKQFVCVLEEIALAAPYFMTRFETGSKHGK